MFFIVLLLLSTVAIAGSAAYFSVYGLANTFSGVFWSVIIMGASLEAGKLVAASYLYRYWSQTNFLLKGYLMAGVAALMVLTSGGIFGYLSSGYQTDVLPLKQIETQIQSLEDEKGRLIVRKKEIDKQIAQLPENFVSARIRLIKQFDEEQKIATKRIRDIDAEELTLKGQQIKAEAHVGPITYVAKAFHIATDDATKWLVLLIIFAFDPMAVALTIAVNTAIRRREEENMPTPAPTQTNVDTNVQSNFAALAVPKPEDKPVAENVAPIQPPVFLPPVATKIIPEKAPLRPRPQISNLEGISSNEKIQEILDHYRNLKEKKGELLTIEDAKDLKTIGEFLKRKGLDVYFK